MATICSALGAGHRVAIPSASTARLSVSVGTRVLQREAPAVFSFKLRGRSNGMVPSLHSWGW